MANDCVGRTDQFMIRVTLPDGTVLELNDGACPADAAAKIGPGLAKAALGAHSWQALSRYAEEVRYFG